MKPPQPAPQVEMLDRRIAPGPAMPVTANASAMTGSLRAAYDDKLAANAIAADAEQEAAVAALSRLESDLAARRSLQERPQPPALPAIHRHAEGPHADRRRGRPARLPHRAAARRGNLVLADRCGPRAHLRQVVAGAVGGRTRNRGDAACAR